VQPENLTDRRVVLLETAALTPGLAPWLLLHGLAPLLFLENSTPREEA